MFYKSTNSAFQREEKTKIINEFKGRINGITD